MLDWVPRIHLCTRLFYLYLLGRALLVLKTSYLKFTLYDILCSFVTLSCLAQDATFG